MPLPGKHSERFNPKALWDKNLILVDGRDRYIFYVKSFRPSRFVEDSGSHVRHDIHL